MSLLIYNEEASEAIAFLQLGNLMLEIYESHQTLIQAGAWDHLAMKSRIATVKWYNSLEKGMVKRIAFLLYDRFTI